MTWIGEVSKIRGKVARPNENPINALDRGNGLDFTESSARLNLDQHASALVSEAMIIGDLAVEIRPRSDGHTPHPAWGIASCRDRSSGLFGILHERNKKRPCPHVQDA